MLDRDNKVEMDKMYRVTINRTKIEHNGIFNHEMKGLAKIKLNNIISNFTKSIIKSTSYHQIRDYRDIL
jgi:hypothetical protein